jgi:hypothetical protein
VKVKALCDIDQRGLTMKAGEVRDVDSQFCNLAGHGMIEILSHEPLGADAPACVMVSADDAGEPNSAGDGAGSDVTNKAADPRGSPQPSNDKGGGS